MEADEDQAIRVMRTLREHGIVVEVDEAVISENSEDALNYIFGTGVCDGRDANATPDLSSSSVSNRRS